MFPKARIYELFLMHKYTFLKVIDKYLVYVIMSIQEAVFVQKKQFENDSFVLYSPDSLNYITNDLEAILNESLELYKKLFDVDKFRKVQINYFDNMEEFKKIIFNNNMIIKLGSNIVEDAFNYYDNNQLKLNKYNIIKVLLKTYKSSLIINENTRNILCR